MQTTFNFYLKKPNHNDNTAIRLVILFNGKRLVYPTKESIHPKDWDFKKQRQKSKQGTVSELNGILQTMKTSAEDVYRRYLNDNSKQLPTADELRELLDKKFMRNVKEAPATLKSIAETYLNEITNRIKPATLKSYRQSLRSLNEFIIAKYGKKFEIKPFPLENINAKLYDNYQTYWLDIKNATPETFKKEVKNIRTFILWGIENDYFDSFKMITQKNDSEDSEAVYLSESEIQSIFDLELPKGSTIDVVRDYFIVSCWTALRYSDCIRIKPKNIKGDYIEIPTQKSNFKKTVLIPIHSLVRRIIEKYHGELPFPISNQKVNVYLKEIALRAGITETITITQKKGKHEIVKTQPKYDLISFHCGRRSFCTNNYLRKMPIKMIMDVSGHTKESTFYKYIRVTPTENANLMLDFWNKGKQNLKVVS